MVEVQHHGFSFEKWVRNTLFQGYCGNYMQKWDIPPRNKSTREYPEALPKCFCVRKVDQVWFAHRTWRHFEATKDFRAIFDDRWLLEAANLCREMG